MEYKSYMNFKCLIKLAFVDVNLFIFFKHRCLSNGLDAKDQLTCMEVTHVVFGLYGMR